MAEKEGGGAHMKLARMGSMRKGADGDGGLTAGLYACTAGCSIVPLAFTIACTVIFWKMWNEAKALNDSVPNWNGGISVYDSCGGFTVPS